MRNNYYQAALHKKQTPFGITSQAVVPLGSRDINAEHFVHWVAAGICLGIQCGVQELQQGIHSIKFAFIKMLK